MTSLLGAVRPNTFNEIFLNESDQDANSVLTELDKALRSTDVGEQCEAIVRFPKLFEKYPFPILINASFLKLAEFFRSGSNLTRLWVLRVCQQTEKHLEKILNVDEFVKRMFTVMHCNDPIARGLTLRTLGACASVIPEKQHVHHAIRRALDSHDMVEVEAAINASVLFAAQSKTFAISMCSKVASMIESLQTPIAMKLQLIPVLKHMHHDANTAALVKQLCVNLLPKYPSENFVIVILDSLTQLSCATLIDIPDQVTLLLAYLEDPRKSVRYQILNSMKSLAHKGAHLWPKGALQNLISRALTCNDIGNEQSLVLSVVLTLTDCPVTCNALINGEQNYILELCSSCLILEHHMAACQALGILTNLIIYCCTEKIIPPKVYMEQINLHLESLIYASSMNEKLTKEFTNYLRCGVKLSAKHLEYAEKFLELIGSFLTDEYIYPTKHLLLFCETLGALCAQFCNKRYSMGKEQPITTPAAAAASTTTTASSVSAGIDAIMIDDEQNQKQKQKTQNGQNPFHLLLPKLLRKLEQTSQLSSNDLDKDQIHFIEILTAVCLQAMLGYFMPRNVFDCLERVVQTQNYWTQYRIARSASRFGQHYLAARILQRIASRISSVKLHFFINSLWQVSTAECILIHGIEYENILENYDVLQGRNNNTNTITIGTNKNHPRLTIIERLDKAVTLYWKALATLKASSSPSQPFIFQSEFIRLRGQFLEALFNIVIIRNTQTITPPPAIAQTLAQNSRDPLQKFGHVTNQLRKAVKSLKICEDLYSKLYKSAFDADPCTLEYLEITQHACAVLGHSVETICFVLPSDPPNLPTEGTYPETIYLIDCCRQIRREFERLPSESGSQKTITTKHTEVILNQIERLIKSPICMPRFYFQILQSTSIKLSITPQPRVAGDPVIVQPGSNLVVKIEGVIQHSGKIRSLYRKIDSIQLTLTSQLISPKSIEFKCANDTIILTQTVKPHHDFLSGSFLIPLNNIQPSGQFGGTIAMGGQWMVTLEAYVIDSNNVLWNTGPKNTLIVRVPDDPTKQQSLSGNVQRRF